MRISMSASNSSIPVHFLVFIVCYSLLCDYLSDATNKPCDNTLELDESAFKQGLGEKWSSPRLALSPKSSFKNLRLRFINNLRDKSTHKMRLCDSLQINGFARL